MSILKLTIALSIHGPDPGWTNTYNIDHQFLVHYLRKKKKYFSDGSNKHCLANEKQIILQIDDYMFKNLLNESIWICLYLILSINDFIRDSICEYQCFCLFHFSLSPTLVAFSNVVLIFAMGMISQFEQLMSYSLKGI